MCPTILLCLIILSLMSVWYKVQILDIDDSTCLIWNHARYSVPGYELENKNGLQCTRHNCNVRGCNASIYITWNDSVPQFRGKSDHDEWNNIKHSIHGHSDLLNIFNFLNIFIVFVHDICEYTNLLEISTAR
eukprot:857338_1